MRGDGCVISTMGWDEDETLKRALVFQLLHRGLFR